MNTKVYVLGNPIAKKVDKACTYLSFLSQRFPDIAFVPLDPTEGLPDIIPNKLIFLDTVRGIKKVTVYDSIDNFSYSPRFSVHDYDLPIQLGILLKIGKLHQVSIIAIPEAGEKGVIEKELVNTLETYVLRKKG